MQSRLSARDYLETPIIKISGDTEAQSKNQDQFKYRSVVESFIGRIKNFNGAKSIFRHLVDKQMFINRYFSISFKTNRGNTS